WTAPSCPSTMAPASGRSKRSPAGGTRSTAPRSRTAPAPSPPAQRCASWWCPVIGAPGRRLMSSSS
ncbi:MAG: hypothetical protein AVDCRST_MAG50-1484, partial [uncultured Acidimicrobiales bacterium]